MNQSRFRTVFLDAGGVLVYPNWERAADTLRRYGVDVDPAVLASVEAAVKRDLDVRPTVRTTSDEERGFLYFDLVLARARVTRTPAVEAALAELEQLHDRQNTGARIRDQVVPARGRLRQSGLTLVVVSNTNGTLRRLFQRTGLAEFVDLVIDSREEGVEKPDARLFVIALARSGADPATTVHLGDLYEIDIAGARAAGLSAVLLDPNGLYDGADCPRVASVAEFADELLSGRFD
jgi:putative hydrolase of the HAD superfamily